MEVGDLVQQRGSGVAIISEYIRSSLSLGCIGIIIEVHDKTKYSYDGSEPNNENVVNFIIEDFFE